MDRSRVCVLVGPTASGKTGASLAVAEALGMEIVSADSMQVYRGMDVGTAKATPEERALVPHHMIDIADPSEAYTAARYRDEGTAAIEGILSRGKVPLVVGGTGLYVSALVDGMNFALARGGGDERRELEAYLAEHGREALHGRLALADPVSAKRLHPNDTRRVVRALEVFALTGKPMSEAAARAESPYDLRVAGLRLNREALYARIDERVGRMIEGGLIAEAEALYGAGAPTASQALGYKELFAHFRGEATLEQAADAIRRETRRYAKRQMTWFRRDERITWFEADAPDLAARLIDFYDFG